jgi:hypothetical protein
MRTAKWRIWRWPTRRPSRSPTHVCARQRVGVPTDAAGLKKSTMEKMKGSRTDRRSICQREGRPAPRPRRTHPRAHPPMRLPSKVDDAASCSVLHLERLCVRHTARGMSLARAHTHSVRQRIKAHVLDGSALPPSHLANLAVTGPSRRSAAALNSSLSTPRSAWAAISEYCR